MGAVLRTQKGGDVLASIGHLIYEGGLNPSRIGLGFPQRDREIGLQSFIGGRSQIIVPPTQRQQDYIWVESLGDVEWLQRLEAQNTLKVPGATTLPAESRDVAWVTPYSPVQKDKGVRRGRTGGYYPELNLFQVFITDGQQTGEGNSGAPVIDEQTGQTYGLIQGGIGTSSAQSFFAMPFKVSP